LHLGTNVAATRLVPSPKKRAFSAFFAVQELVENPNHERGGVRAAEALGEFDGGADSDIRIESLGDDILIGPLGCVDASVGARSRIALALTVGCLLQSAKFTNRAAANNHRQQGLVKSFAAARGPINFTVNAASELAWCLHNAIGY
jgi:hypothetical protein